MTLLNTCNRPVVTAVHVNLTPLASRGVLATDAMGVAIMLASLVSMPASHNKDHCLNHARSGLSRASYIWCHNPEGSVFKGFLLCWDRPFSEVGAKLVAPKGFPSSLL